ncbi:ninja-family protein AFP3-like [Typha angustifolia]|uniref:ninja-family protein AFP3-like n=1 Tax=Typha angustifolia TaxID=59011 RepID=UPI003C2F9983
MAGEAAEEEIEEVSERIGSYPRDLLRHLSEINCNEENLERKGDDLGEIDINLGLSLGGCFGVEPSKEKRLLRSSSVAGLSIPPVEYDFLEVNLLTRTTSLPAMAADDEHRKRKELQSLKRMEAKRKRLEKRNSKGGERDRKEDNMDEEMVTEQGPKCFPLMSQGSIGSQGSGFSSFSNLEIQETQEVKRPPSVEHNEHKAEPNLAAGMVRRLHNYASGETGPTGKADLRAKEAAVEARKGMMEEMPCVSTRGVGPNGRRIEGFLYKYKKGEEVRIVCVCHGNFLTPAEFVKHAGGGDVAHPLRHIVVSPSPSTIL